MTYKSTKWFASILILLTCSPLLVLATITDAEYFYNSDDLGPGNNSSLSVSLLNGIATATGSNLPTSELGSGIHTIYSRIYDDQYGWGAKRGRQFLVTSIVTDNSISAAEYFFDDDDNGAGFNTPLSLSLSSGIATATGTNLATDGLASGIHIIYSRFYANNHGWGATRGTPFLITHEATEYTISGAEYFIDSDPGVGQGSGLNVTLSNGVATATGSNLPTDGLSVGFHVIYSRFYAENFGWGTPRGVPFLITSTEAANTITAAEYFIDSDPGIGQGNSLSLSGTANQVSLNTQVDLSESSAGLHSISIRLFSLQAGWGAARSALFNVSSEATVTYIQSAQYFIGDQPGNSEIITISSPTDGTFDELSEVISLSNVAIPDGATGLQTVGVRFQRADGEWSAWRTTQFLVVQNDPLYTISAAEYFLDVDPGPGSGVAIEAPLDGSYDEIEEEFNLPVSIEGLPEGGHFAYLRLQRSDGKWGAPRGNYFIISEDAQPTIAGAEYYINPATPEGSGITFSPLDGAFNTTQESVSAITNLASLNAQTPGNYTVYVRFKNSRGEWGPVGTHPFTVQIRPQIDTNADTLDFAALFTGETRSLSLTISNIGDADLIVSTLNFSDAAYTANWSGGTITPLGAQTINVTFAPVEPAGNHPATLTITNNDAAKVITLQGRGLDTAPIMAVSPDSLTFGTVQTIANATLSVRVSNSGNEDLVLTGATSTSPAFTASIPNPTVVPSEYVDVDITFAPSLGQTYIDTLYLLSNDTYFPSYPIYVSGAGSIVPVPDIQVSIESLNFGNIALENAPKNLGFVISNTGTANLNIISVVIDEAAFITSLTAGQSIAASGSLQITVSFNPTESRRYSGTLTLQNDDPDSPQIIIPLSGSSVFPNMVLIPGNTFNFGDVGVTTSNTQSLIVSNIGSDTLKISSFEKSASLDTILTIAPGSFNLNPFTGQRNFSLNFRPAEPVGYEGIVIIHSNADNDTLYVTGTGIDDEAPAIVFNPNAIENIGTSENSPINISAVISDNNQVSWVRLYYRQGGKVVYDSTAMSLQSGAYQGTIPPAYVRNRGVEYYIKAFDGANTQVIPATAPDVPAIVRVRLPSLPPFTFTAETYGMISVPSDLDQKNVLSNLESDIGEYNINSWRLFRWINGNYVELSENENFTFEPGNAYWLITSEREVINMDSSTSVKTNEEYLISLDQGWNQVGTPYYFPVSWSDVYAASPGVVQGSIAYEWVNDDWAPATVMQPFGGYFISTSSGGNILRFPPKEAVAGTAKKATIPFNLAENEWLLKFSAENSHSRELYNYIGVLNDAATGLDLRDQPKPPAMYSDRVQLFSEHGEWGATGSRFSGDFQAASDQGNFWDLTLLTGAVEDDILLSLERLGELPSSFEIRVLNLDLRYELNEHHDGEYIQRHFASQDRYRLRVMAGTSEFLAKHDEGITQAPDQFRLAQNYPNPFNGETRIQFDIPEPTGLRIVIYDMTGREVVELLRSDAHAVGYHEISWSGNNSSGHRVASGIYLISFQSDSFRATRKMVLLK